MKTLIFIFILANDGNVYWQPADEKGCLQIERALAEGAKVEAERHGKRSIVKAGKCFEVDDIDEIYGRYMEWLRNDGNEEPKAQG